MLFESEESFQHSMFNLFTLSPRDGSLGFPSSIRQAPQQFLGFTYITKSRVESIIDQNVFLSKENRSTGSDIIDNNKTKLKINKGMKVRFGKELPDKFLPYIHQVRDSGASSLHNTLLIE